MTQKPMKLLVCAHAVSTVMTMWMGSTTAIVDLGHMLFPARPQWRYVTECLTLTSVWWAFRSAENPRRVAMQAMRLFGFLWALRIPSVVLTMLPPLTPPGEPRWHHFVFGSGYDYVFSGHTAFVASWILASEITWYSVAFAVVHAAALLITRMHYTVDIAIAWALALLARSSSAVHPGTPQIIRIALVPEKDREFLRSLRRDVYVDELHQQSHADPEVAPVCFGVYHADSLVADSLVAYIALTPPRHPKKTPCFRSREWDDAYELRALTVSKKYRHRGYAKLLLAAASRYVQLFDSKSTMCVAAARCELLELYQSLGFTPMTTVPTFTKGHVTYVPGYVDMTAVTTWWAASDDFFRNVHWDLPYSPIPSAPCPHGNGSTHILKSYGFRVHADVLDAWYPPAPDVIDAVRTATPWAFHTTPPDQCQDLIDAIAHHRGVPSECLVLGAGSSDLMYRCFLRWFSRDSTVLLVTPTYSEYPHLLKHVIQCTVDEVSMVHTDPCDYIQKHADSYDGIVIVNPNSPLGIRFDTDDLVAALSTVSLSTRVWIDETYVDYTPGRSLEPWAHRTPNVVVCKSMSKVYALSGMRLGYLCANPVQLDAIRAVTPPWILGRLTIDAGLAAIRSSSYYRARIDETHVLRKHFIDALAQCPGVKVLYPDTVCANFFVFLVTGIESRFVIHALKTYGVYVRDAPGIPGGIRVAVRSSKDNARVVHALSEILSTV
jgi:histidinol-phosphate/aromatic aminotransferase/cobyric acid decarboxylase-like protein/GNAT superfamily N-acetyltransferase